MYILSVMIYLLRKHVQPDDGSFLVGDEVNENKDK